MEITARELSYKNLINHKELGTVEVVGFNEEIIQYLHLDTIYYDEYSKLEAVKLTEKWLLKFGFEKYDFMNGFFMKLKDRHLMVQFYKTEIHIFFTKVSKDSQGHWMKGRDYFIDKNSILFCHQLQNLYYALTQTELTLTK